MSKRPVCTTLEQAFFCAKCSSRALFAQEYSGPNFKPGEVFTFKCPTSCREKEWFFCMSCHCRGYCNGLERHAGRRKHQENSDNEFRTREQTQGQGQHQLQLQASNDNNGDSEDAMMPPTDGSCNKAVDDDDFYIDDEPDDHEMTDVATAKDSVSNNMDQKAANRCYFPRLKLSGHEWLAEALKDVQIADGDVLSESFSKAGLEHMANFYVAELGSGEGQCGGGLMYLAARAFQQCKDTQLDQNLYPDYEEAKWQMNNLIQYQSMNEKQRQRQSRLYQELMRYMPPKKFFKTTHLPAHNQLGRHYGSTGQHSMYNNLPCPRAVDIDGVAFVRPLAVIAFVMGTGIPIDDIVVTADSPPPAGPEYLRRVHNVDGCKKAVSWFEEIQKNYYGSENGAPSSNFGAPKHPAVVCLYLSDWTDGFDSAKVKSNRNAIDSKTLTVSPPKNLVNATDNTFAVALGLKKAKGWKKVEEMFRAEVEELCNSKEPILFYHGTTQKMVPCFFRRFAVLSDKQERNTLTGTLGCGSNIHRCFGISGAINTPSCKIPELKEFFSEESRGKATSNYGWSYDFIEQNANGAAYPSCASCRKIGLQKILGLKRTNAKTKKCGLCENWDLIAPTESSNKKLQFPVHKDYPKSFCEGSPVPAPEGRNVFREGISLPMVRITWQLMSQACKFAFYQASRPHNHCWNKGETVCYLKHCGVSTTLAALLFEAAKISRKQPEADYGQAHKIGNFHFDPAWLSTQISLQDFIEAIMHQLFLGASESNFELITDWLSSTPSAAKLGHSSFLQALQVLIKDLRPFNLSWLLAYPLTGKKGKLGTGSWVAENWVFFTRVSQFIFGWCCKNDGATKYGVEDMSRVVIAFHAFVARCLTHAGMDGAAIDEAELYMKEFLSSLREFDVRVRHDKLNKPTNKVSEQKKSEAWWLKPNYMSLCNLLYIARILGPLVLWWDGGGKGERFIQMVKPHIKRGVRDDVLSFFVTLLEKLFRVRILDIFEKRFELEQDDNRSQEEEESVLDLLNDFADLLLPPDEEDESSDEEDAEDEEDDGPAAPQVRIDDAYFSTNEVHGMTKNKAFYVYRNQNVLNEMIAAGKPITGIVEVKTSPDGSKTAFEFQTVFRKPGESGKLEKYLKFT